MKNKCLIFIVFVLCLLLPASAFADDSASACGNEGCSFDYAASKMPCEMIPENGMSETALENMEILGAPNENDWSVGPEDALITIIEYSDFQCPYCRNVSLNLVEYQKKHPSEVRLIYRHFPLSFHDKAVVAATAANAAGDQDMFFDAVEFLFENQTEWSGFADNNAFIAWLCDKFESFSDLDFEKWFLAFSDNDRLQEAQDTYNQVIETGIVGGTPTVFVNFEQMNDISEQELDKKLLEAKTRGKSFASCPDIVISEGMEYQAVLETEVGDIHIDLFADTAPMAVNNFKFLAENGWYGNNKILKKQEGFMIQSGDPSNTMYGAPGYYFATEYDESRLFDGTGYLGMANSGRDKNGGQYFITYDFYQYYTDKIREDSAVLDIDESKIEEYVAEKIQKFSKAYTVFGKVVDEDLPLLEQLEEGMMIYDIKVSAR